MYWLSAQTEACLDFNRHGAQRRGRPSSIFSAGADSSIRRHGSRRFIVVSTSLRSHGRFSYGELQPAGASCPESRARIYLRRPAHIVEPPSRPGTLQSHRIKSRPAIEKEAANTLLL